VDEQAPAAPLDAFHDALTGLPNRRLLDVRKADTVARHGADEFALVVADLQAEAGCRLVAERLLRSMAEAMPSAERPVALAVSVGISMFPADAGDGEGLLRNAGVALQRAKQAGHNQFAFYGK